MLLTQAEARLLGLTQTGTERPVETRPTRETLLHWTAALSFSLTVAYLYARLEGRSVATARLPRRSSALA